MTREKVNDPLLESARVYCERLIAGRARSFSFAARFLPHAVRQDVYALYAFCRTVDDLVDLPEKGVAASVIRSRLDTWYAWLRMGAPPDADPVRYALAHAVRRHNMPLHPLIELVNCMRDDIEPRRITNGAELEQYCYGAAGTVGVAMATMLGAGDDRALGPARDLGIAMQLTNILRDVAEDLARGRIYLPTADLAWYGYEQADLERGVIDDRFRGLMRTYIAQARWYYAEGLRGLVYLPRESRFPIALAAHSYAAILTGIERADFDVFSRRIHVTRHERLILAARLGANHARAMLPRFSATDREKHVVSYLRS
jgi:phytoene synthase